MSRIVGLGTLRLKETDRLQALGLELGRIGIKTRVSESSIEVQGGVARGALIRTYDDHRMAMSFGMLGAKIEGIVIESPEVVSKSFPGFWDELTRLGIGVRFECS